jgi:hypothetical protein
MAQPPGAPGWQPPVSPAGFAAHGLLPNVGAGYAPGCPPGGGYGPACPPGGGFGAHQVGEPSWFYDSDSRFDQTFHETLRRSWFRVGYVYWEIQNPGKDLLGARMATEDPRDPLGFQAFDVGSVPRIGVFARVPDLQFIDSSQLNGIRGEVGIPMTTGALEMDVWAVQQFSDERNIRPQVDPITGFVTIPAITLLSAGNPSDNTMVLFDTNYQAAFQATVFGTQADFVFQPVNPGIPLSVQSVVGVRYVRYDEELNIRGRDQASNNGAGLNPRVHSEAFNNIVGPQFGVRAGMDSKWLSFNVEPKLLLAINRHQDKVTASEILAPITANTPLVRDVNEDTDFAPGFSLSGEVRIHCTETFSLFAGYELLALSNVSRSSDIIVYDSPLEPIDNPSLIRREKDRAGLFMHGAFVGGEFRFR